MKDKLNELIKILDLLEQDIFHSGTAEFYGKTYTHSEWREYKEVLKKVLDNTEAQQKASAKYLDNHKEYNRKMRLISYYRHKKNKTENDYIQIEQLRRELENYLKERKEKKERKKERELKQAQEALIKLSNYSERGE